MPIVPRSSFRRLRLTAAICFASVSLAAADAGAQAPDSVTIAVLRFNNGAIGKANAELEPLSFGIPEVLMSELAADKRIRLFERARLNDLVREQKIGATGTVDETTAAQMGKLLGVRHVVFGAFMGAKGDSIRVIARLVNVETQAVEAIVTEQDHVDNVLGLLAVTALELSKGIPGPKVAARTRAGAMADAPEATFTAVMAFSKALAAMSSGDGARARTLLMEAIAAAPGWKQPRWALDELAKQRKEADK